MSNSPGIYSPKDEQKLMSYLWSEEIKDNPYNFVMFVFPWGKPGTPLANFKEPRAWQKKILLEIADHIKENKARVARGELPTVYQLAVSSGRGIGKSALVGWISLWMMSCILGGTTIIAANTEDQLKSKTWAEIGKWHAMMINTHWFDKLSIELRPAPWFRDALSKQLKLDATYYYAQGQLWSEENPDAFAGAHNYNGMCVIYDEASGIVKPIWTVTKGFFTEPTVYRFWFAFSNPRRNTGAFYECFHALRDFWRRLSIDSRTVEGTDPAVYQSIIDENGEDSDAARVEVKGEFPRQSDDQFISREIVDEAINRKLEQDDYAALIMGVDPARKGSASTVIRFRQGRNGRVLPPVILKGKDNMAVANRCAELITEFEPDAVCIDTGNGTGIIDRLREMGYKVFEVWFGGESADPQYANKRTEIWAQMKDWLPGGCIDGHEDLKFDLTNIEKRFQKNSDKIRLETKEEMEARHIPSPDHGDALACTFFVKVARKDNKLFKGPRSGKVRMAKDVNYDPFS